MQKGVHASIIPGFVTDPAPRMTKVFLLLFLSLALLAGCGQKGPLVPPPAAVAGAY